MKEGVVMISLFSVVLLISFCILTKESGSYCDILQMHDVKIHQQKAASVEHIFFYTLSVLCLLMMTVLI